MSNKQPNKQPVPVKKPTNVKQAPKQWKAQDYVSPKASIEEVREIKSAFDIFDTSGNGVVDAIELRNAFISLGFASNNKFVSNILEKLDAQHPNGLNFGSFLCLATNRLGQGHTRKQIQTIFKSIDHNKFGKINAHQFKQVAEEIGQHLTDQEIQKIFIKTDTDNDGYVTAQDIYAITSARKW